MKPKHENRQIVVLHVEDNDNDVTLVREAFEAIGSAVVLHRVRDGLAAIEFVRKQAPRPDLIILDMHLPQKSGVEVLQELKMDANHMDIPIVIFSASNSSTEVNAAYRGHANSYIRKPEGLDEFFGTIASLERYWSHTVALPSRS